MDSLLASTLNTQQGVQRNSISAQPEMLPLFRFQLRETKTTMYIKAVYYIYTLYIIHYTLR